MPYPYRVTADKTFTQGNLIGVTVPWSVGYTTFREAFNAARAIHGYCTGIDAGTGNAFTLRNARIESATAQ